MNMNLRINMNAQNGGIRISGGEVRLCRCLAGYNMHNRKGNSPSPLASNFPPEAFPLSPFSSLPSRVDSQTPSPPLALNWRPNGEKAEGVLIRHPILAQGNPNPG